jgi:hypothetical protein
MCSANKITRHSSKGPVYQVRTKTYAAKSTSNVVVHFLVQLLLAVESRFGSAHLAETKLVLAETFTDSWSIVSSSKQGKHYLAKDPLF